jgi:hypothetical protein
LFQGNEMVDLLILFVRPQDGLQNIFSKNLMQVRDRILVTAQKNLFMK